MDNVGTFIFEIFQKLLSAGSVIYSFLFSTVTVGDITFSPFAVLGGATLVTLIVLKFIKDFVPLA